MIARPCLIAPARALVALASPVLSVLLLASCQGGEPESAEMITIAVVPKAMNNPFFDQARDGCKAAEAELEHTRCEYIGPGEATEAEQIQIVQDLITRGVDALAIAPSNAPAMASVLGRAAQAGIPVITWDSDLLAEDQHLRLTYIGTDNREIGVELGRLLQTLRPAAGTLCIQSGGAAAQNHNERMQGLRDTLSGVPSEAPPGDRLEGVNGWIEAPACPLYSNDDFPLAVQQMTDALASIDGLAAFVATGGFPQFVDQAYRQAVQVHRERLESGDIHVLVTDTLPMQMALLREGLSHGQVGQRPYEMGYRAMHLLAEVLAAEAAGEPLDVPDPILTGLDVCTQETAETCIAQ